MNTYYISTGEQTKMYTLRVRYPDTVYTSEGKVEIERDYYICNLSIDKDKAKEKARAYIADDWDSKFSDVELFSLEEIRRRTSEEVEAARIASENAAKEKFEAEERQRRQDAFDKIQRGVWPFGMYHGDTFATAHDGYIVYFLSLESDDSDPVLIALQTVLTKEFPHLANLPEANGEYYGEIKKREDFVATLIAKFSFDGFYGRVYIQKFVKDSGELLVYKGSAPVDADMGKPIKFKATIKSHEEYKSENQTFIQRVKVAA